MTDVTVDTREPPELYTYLCNTFKDKKFRWKKLDEGDYLSDKVICERKTIPDLYSSILDNRLWNQVNRINHYEGMVKVLLVTGNVESFVKYTMARRKKFINAKLIYSTIADVMLRYDFMILWSPTDEEGLISLMYVMEHIDDGKYLVPYKANYDALCAKLLNITVKQWQAINADYCSLAALSRATLKDLMEYDGIGNVRAKYILETLNKGRKTAPRRRRTKC